MRVVVKIFNNSKDLEDFLNRNFNIIIDFKLCMTDNYLMVCVTLCEGIIVVD